ncbi:MAG: hypothetical protein ACFCUI_12985 [Bernardetiaceae bacterium]
MKKLLIIQLCLFLGLSIFVGCEQYKASQSPATQKVQPTRLIRM